MSRTRDPVLADTIDCGEIGRRHDTVPPGPVADAPPTPASEPKLVMSLQCIFGWSGFHERVGDLSVIGFDASKMVHFA